MTFKFEPSVIEKHTAILGMTGSGKTSTAKLLIEQVCKDARVCILDPLKSDWWGITSSRDGAHAGLPFDILGGPHGHVPLHAGAGKAIGELVAKGSLKHSIIDMADFEPGGTSKFFNDFAAAVFKHTRGVLYLVLEEAHEFAPKERSGVGNENMSVYYAKKLATGARSKGLRLVVCTQRVQSLHNAILGSCATVIAHRFIAPADQEPVMGWLKGAVKDRAVINEIAASLSDLNDGEAYQVHGKDIERIQFPPIRTFDNSAAPTSDDELHVVQAKVDTSQLRAIIGDAVKEAEANDPAKLKARIAELERQAQARPAAAPPAAADPLEVDQAYKDGYAQGRDRGWKDCAELARPRLTGLVDHNKRSIGDIEHIIELVMATPKFAVESFSIAPTPAARSAPDVRGVPAAIARLPPDKKPNGAGEHVASGGERAVLQACIQFPAGLKRNQLSILTGYKKTSRDTYISRLVPRGLLEVQGDTIIATAAGRRALPDAEPLPTGQRLRSYWLERLPPGERAILEVLIVHYPKDVTRELLTEHTDYKKTSRDTYLSRLAAKQLVTDRGPGRVRAAEELF